MRLPEYFEPPKKDADQRKSLIDDIFFLFICNNEPKQLYVGISHSARFPFLFHIQSSVDKKQIFFNIICCCFGHNYILMLQHISTKQASYSQVKCSLLPRLNLSEICLFFQQILLTMPRPFCQLVHQCKENQLKVPRIWTTEDFANDSFKDKWIFRWYFLFTTMNQKNYV